MKVVHEQRADNDGEPCDFAQKSGQKPVDRKMNVFKIEFTRDTRRAPAPFGNRHALELRQRTPTP